MRPDGAWAYWYDPEGGMVGDVTDGLRNYRAPMPAGLSDPWLAASSDFAKAPPFQPDRDLIGYIEEANEGPRP